MTVLTLVMIAAVITITGLFVTRLPNFAAAPALPETLELPQGARAQAVTMGAGWIAIVTQDQHILVFSFDGKLLQDIAIKAD